MFTFKVTAIAIPLVEMIRSRSETRGQRGHCNRNGGIQVAGLGVGQYHEAHRWLQTDSRVSSVFEGAEDVLASHCQTLIVVSASLVLLLVVWKRATYATILDLSILKSLIC